MPVDYSTDPRLRRFCRDHGLAPSAIAQLDALVQAFVAEEGGATRLTTGGTAPPEAPEAPVFGEADRYEDLGRIGAGATGDVRRVRDRHMGRTLAMKVLHKALLEHPGAVARLRREAELTAALDHPGVVVVHDRGTLPDGRPYFTMPEVRGETLRAVLAGGRWPLRRRVDAFARLCQAIAYAHSRGVLHRDLKPENVMVGAFGAVLVMDWGLACRVEEAAPGAVAGTPGYIAPEVARGERPGAAADVYALGGTLHFVLAGSPPRAAGPWGEEEVPLPDAPAELVALQARARAPDPADRPDAAALAEEALAWLDGARRREQAEALVERTAEQMPAVRALQAAGAAALAEAEAARRDADPERRRVGWRRDAEAAERSREAALAEAEVERELHAALNLDPASEAAHGRLADLYRDRMARAEARGDTDAASIAEVLLRAHDRGRHAAWLQGDGALSLRTDPPGARVTLHPFVERERRRVLGPGEPLGVTPLREVRVPRGSHLLVVEAPGHAPMRVPVALGRLDRWDSEVVLPLLPEGAAPGGCYVPAGWFTPGGDPDAADCLPARRLWVDGFVIQRFPVTHGEWLGFVRAEAAAGRDVEALLPRTKEGNRPIYRLGPDGWEAGPDDRGELWEPRFPITQVTWHAARRYAASRPPLLGAPWRLPDEVEWEKAARGADGRTWPWGRHFEPAELNMATRPGPPGRTAVDAWPDDESPYGVVGLGGNVRDLCSNAWTADGDLPAERLVPRVAGPDAELVVLRGGNWYSSMNFCRAAMRFVGRPDDVVTGVGFRLVASFPVSSPTRP